MHVVGHQHISMDGTAKFGSKFLQVMQVKLKIVFSMKTNRAVVTALNDVPGDTGYGEACSTWHWFGRALELRNPSRKTWSVPYFSAIPVDPETAPTPVSHASGTGHNRN